MFHYLVLTFVIPNLLQPVTQALQVYHSSSALQDISSDKFPSNTASQVAQDLCIKWPLSSTFHQPQVPYWQYYTTTVPPLLPISSLLPIIGPQPLSSPQPISYTTSHRLPPISPHHHYHLCPSTHKNITFKYTEPADIPSPGEDTKTYRKQILKILSIG